VFSSSSPSIVIIRSVRPAALGTPPLLLRLVVPRECLSNDRCNRKKKKRRLEISRKSVVRLVRSVAKTAQPTYVSINRFKCRVPSRSIVTVTVVEKFYSENESRPVVRKSSNRMYDRCGAAIRRVRIDG